MNRHIVKIRQEWERSLLVAVGLLLLGLLGWMGFSFFSEKGGSTSQSQALPPPPDFIDIKSFAFMQPARLRPDVNPMAFRKKLPKAFVTPPPPPKPGDGAVKPPAGVGSVKPSDVKPSDVKPSDVKPTPKPPPRKISVLYRGMYKGLTDRELAFISADDSKSKKSKVFYLGAGGKIHGVLTVKGFSPDSLVLDCGGDREVTVRIGKKQDIVLE